jgi:hypothetical protein
LVTTATVAPSEEAIALPVNVMTIASFRALATRWIKCEQQLPLEALEFGVQYPTRTWHLGASHRLACPFPDGFHASRVTSAISATVRGGATLDRLTSMQTNSSGAQFDYQSAALLTGHAAVFSAIDQVSSF